jgi:hypothetical protein
MTRETCKMPGCDNDRRTHGTPYSRKFCSDKHEVKYDHLKADARDAQRDEQRDRHHDDAPRHDAPR